jgi:serine/threonine protein kinase
LNIGELRSVGGEGTPPPVGEVVGKYRLIRDLGIGGMARVSLATLEGPAGFSKRYVVKRILPEFARNPQFARMFANEARVAAMLDHPNIVRVFEFDRENGTYYLVMEYVDGASLDQIVRAARKGGVPLGPDFAVEVGLPLARALAYAHSLKLPDGRPLNLVHRDVSPGNVLISRDGAVKLTDFGVVKSTITTTVAGAVKGKLSYMSPEQITVQNVDHRSDLFSLGVVLYEVATGLRLFRGDSLGATAVRVMRAVVPPPRSVMPDTDPRLEAILMRLLERDPRARYQSAADLLIDLEGYRSSGAGDKRSIPVHDIVNLLFPPDSHISMIPSQGSMVSGSSSISVNTPGFTPGFEVDPAAAHAADAELDVPLQFMHDDPQRPAFPSARDMQPTPQPAGMASAVHPSVFVPVLTVDEGVPMKLIVAVTLACLIGSLIFWFAVF